MSDVTAVVSTVRWSEDSYYLKEFVHKFKLPQLAKVVKGQYLGVGVSTISSPSLQSTVLLCPAPPRPSLIVQSVKFKDGKRVVGLGPKLSIPHSYDGFFEILSEDGRSVRCIESVQELSRRFPESVLVRDNIKAFVSKSDDVENLGDKCRTITVGEVLILVGEVLGVKGKSQTRYLRCIDRAGENVFLPLEQKGRFSAIAKEENISGVHHIRNLVKKRLPLMARLAHGPLPFGHKSSQVFVPDLRVLGRTEEGGILALPLGKEGSPLYLPLAANLKLQPAQNNDFIAGMPELRRLEERVSLQFESMKDSILVYDISLPREGEKKNIPGRKSSLPPSDPYCKTGVYGIITSRSDSGRSDDYDEIDQIYDYVRGFAPLPKSAKGWQYMGENIEERKERLEERKEAIYGKLKAGKADASKEVAGKEGVENEPPEPPPIETIPSRKFSLSHMDLSPPLTPNYSPPWGSPTHGYVTPLAPSGQVGGACTPALTGTPTNLNTVLDRRHSADVRLFEKSSESKKRQRPKTAGYVGRPEREEKPKAVIVAPTTSRYVKASHKQGGVKHKFFKSRKDKDVPPPPLGSSPQTKEVKTVGGQPSFFHLRYKSLTNLTAQEYDTLDSSHSGGKTSFDSAGSRNIPEKRSRKLTRPKSLTNLVWDFRTTSPSSNILRSNSKPNLLVADKGRQEVRGVRRGARDPSPLAMRIGGKHLSSTLYL